MDGPVEMSPAARPGDPLVLAIDNGSQSTKVTIVDAAGRVLARAQQPLRPYAHPAPGQVVHPGDDVWESIVAACRAVLADSPELARRVVGVGLCTIRFCRALIGADDRLTQPLLSWMDPRVGAPPPTDPSVRWLAASSGYVTLRLTGAHRDTRANYAGWWPLDHDTLAWATDAEVLARFGMDPRRLFDLVDPGALLGHVGAQAASQTGLTRGLPVFATANDKAVEALGAGLLDDRGTVLSLGTYIAAQTVAPAGPVPGHDSLGRYWVNAGAVPGMRLLESAGIRRGMWTVSWVRELLAGTGGIGSLPLAVLEAEAAEVPAGCGGLAAIMDWLAPTDHPERRGAFVGFDGSQGRGATYRAVLEGIALTMAANITTMNEALGRSSGATIVTGGGSHSPVFLQIIADVTGRPAVALEQPDAVGTGAAITAMVGAGVHPNWAEAVASMVHVAHEVAPHEATSRAYATLARRYAVLREGLHEALARAARAEQVATVAH